MKSIKTYLFPLILIAFFTTSGFSQSKADNDKKEKISKTDSILVHTYFTEEDYNEKHEIENNNQEVYSSDEVYNEKGDGKHHKKETVLGDVAVEIIVEVVVNTLFFIAAFWH